MKMTCGPIHKKEANNYFSFESSHFSETGIFLDLDVSKSKNLEHKDIPSLVKKAMKVTWERIDNISKSVGL